MGDEHSSKAGRRATDSTGTDLAPIGRPVSAKVDAAFEAQLMAQGTIKRGLRGGKEVLDAARSTYLKTEWSGPADRRPPSGLLTKTKA